MDKSKQRTYWDSFEQEYQMGNQSHREYLLNLLAEKGANTILDVGCGTGPIYELIQRPDMPDFVQYKGTDYSPAMIEICKRNFPQGNWQVEDARHLSEPDSSWDCVLLMHSLDHLDDYEAAIREAARVARKYVLIVLWRGINYAPGAENNLNDKNMMGKEEGQDPWEDTHLQDYSWEKLDRAFAKAGLVVIEKNDGEEVNKEGKFNTLILLQK